MSYSPSACPTTKRIKFSMISPPKATLLETRNEAGIVQSLGLINAYERHHDDVAKRGQEEDGRPGGCQEQVTHRTC